MATIVTCVVVNDNLCDLVEWVRVLNLGGSQLVFFFEQGSALKDTKITK